MTDHNHDKDYPTSGPYILCIILLVIAIAALANRVGKLENRIAPIELQVNSLTSK